MDINSFYCVLAERWLSIFSADLLRYAIGVGVVVATLFGPLRQFAERRRIQARSATRADVSREVLCSLRTAAVYATVGLGTVEIIERGWTRMYTSISASNGWWLPVSVLALLVLHDAYFYWVHRLMHHPRLFRHVHRTHHLSRTPTSWAAYSFSVSEAALMALFVPLVLQLLPVHPLALSVFLILMILRNAMGHCGVEFHPPGWVDGPLDALTTTTHHDLHHQQPSGNYGLYFTWWDRLMGTELPGYRTAFRNLTGASREREAMS
jgi:sterol desaturase/sphingolipid hydroxylase (fatty acid hydroxylase superfamily)